MKKVFIVIGSVILSICLVIGLSLAGIFSVLSISSEKSAESLVVKASNFVKSKLPNSEIARSEFRSKENQIPTLGFFESKKSPLVDLKRINIVKEEIQSKRLSHVTDQELQSLNRKLDALIQEQHFIELANANQLGGQETQVLKDLLGLHVAIRKQVMERIEREL